MFSSYISCFQAVETNVIEDREEELCRFVRTTSTPCSRKFCRKTMNLLGLVGPRGYVTHLSIYLLNANRLFKTFISKLSLEQITFKSKYLE